MLDILEQAEAALPALIQDKSIWRSLCIDYHPPLVERLWTQWGDYRINLHLIESCSGAKPLFHPHPWPSAMKILEHQYLMEVGFGKNEPPASERMKILLTAGSTYEMLHPDQWHSVDPGCASTTLMVTGKPWNRESPKSDKPLKELSPERFLDLWYYFKIRYARR